MQANPICVAIDTPDLSRARHLARVLRGRVGYVKLGMEFFYANGADGYRAVAAEGIPLFLDLKLHDIPNTVAEGLRSLMRLDPTPAIINVHAAGGGDMMKAAVEAVAGRAKLIAVTMLTSLSDDDALAIGFNAARDAQAHAAALASLAHRCSVDGVVCSPREVAAIREAEGPDFLTVVPGIRPAEAATQDQKRIATPRAACEAGADILVIGRPITQAADPAQAAKEILERLASSPLPCGGELFASAAKPPDREGPNAKRWEGEGCLQPMVAARPSPSHRQEAMGPFLSPQGRGKSVEVKICGLSTAETVRVALDAGADLIGLVFYPKSPRSVSLERAAALASLARGKAKIVALTVDADETLIADIEAMVVPDLHQAHGHESPEQIRALHRRTGKPVIKAIKVRDAGDIAAAKAYAGAASLILFDAKAPETLTGALPGGNGVAFDWSLLAGPQVLSFMLSGGLNPGNVAEAIRTTGARLVDASSGVESAPGVKDAALIRKFIEAAKAVG